MKVKSILGMPVVTSPHVDRGAVLLVNPSGQHVRIIMHWIDIAMRGFDHDLWWRETPAESAARIVGEVLRWHAGRPSATPALAAAARAEMDERGLT